MRQALTWALHSYGAIQVLILLWVIVAVTFTKPLTPEEEQRLIYRS